MTVCVIGAGVAGAACARRLHEGGADVVVLEKARGVGGRMSTRRVEGRAFDHGAAVIAPADGLEALRVPLEPFADGLVPAGAMNAPVKALCDGLDVRTQAQAAHLEMDGTVRAADGTVFGPFDRVLVTAPAPQASHLLRPVAPVITRRARAITFRPCWTVMAAWAEPLALPIGWHRGHAPGLLAWAGAEAGKPGRAPGERWVLQAGGSWSHANLEADKAAVIAAVLVAFAEEVAGGPVPAPALTAAHRWLYAHPERTLQEHVLVEGRFGAAGDWCGGHDVGAALTSGLALADAVLASG